MRTAIFPLKVAGTQNTFRLLCAATPLSFQYRQRPITVLCIDNYSGCNTEDRGERPFDSDGERTQFLNTMLNFVEAYQKQYQITRLFCKQLAELGLLEPMRQLQTAR